MNYEGLLVSSNNVSTVEDFLRTFGVTLVASRNDGRPIRVPTHSLRPSPGRRPMPADGPGVAIGGRHDQSFAKPAGCEPTPEVVELEYPSAAGSRDVIFPDCIRLKRCSGCCRPSGMILVFINQFDCLIGY